MLARAWELCSTTLQRLSLNHTRAHEYLQSLRILRDKALLTYGNAPDDSDSAAAPLPLGDADHDARPEVRVEGGPYGALEDAQPTANAAWGTGFLEHDWGVPFFLDNWGDVGIEQFLQQGQFEVDEGAEYSGREPGC